MALFQDGSAAVRDEESNIHRALMKYLDAWSLVPNSWEFNLQVGRLLLLQGRSQEALQHLQSGLVQEPLHITLRLQCIHYDLSICNIHDNSQLTMIKASFASITSPSFLFFSLRFFTGLALLQQEQKASEGTEKEAALFLQQGLEHLISQRCSKRFVCLSVCVRAVEADVDAISVSVRV